MESILDQLKRFGIVRLGIMTLVSIGLLSFFGIIILRAAQPSLSVLYTDLAPEDSAAILRDLEARGIAYELHDDGRTIYAAKSEIARLRFDLASKGIPSGGTVGYEIFDKTDSFSTTGFVQSINQTRALEGELSRSIRTVGAVQSARVHLVIPEHKLFERDRQPPRASIALKVRGELSTTQVNAIRRLVASSVEGLKPETISIIDEQGRLLADGTAEDNGLSAIIDERQATIEKRLKHQIEDIVTNIVGDGRARVQVATELDPSHIQTISESYDPDSRVVRSTQNRNESQSTVEAKDGTVSVANELPGANSQNSNQKEASGKNEEIVNYEISKTTRTEVSDGGKIRRLSVAVLVDGQYTKGPNGELTYQPRPQQELDRIAALVKSGVGFDQKRGDQIEVVNLRFAAAPDAVADAPAGGMIDWSRFDVSRIIELSTLAIISLIIALTVGRPLLKAMALPAPRQPSSGWGTDNDLDALDGNPLDMISGLITSNPQASATTVRQWLQDNR